MTKWITEDLSRIGEAEEIKLATVRADGALRPYVTMWVVRAGDELYIRSAYGPDNPWFPAPWPAAPAVSGPAAKNETSPLPNPPLACTDLLTLRRPELTRALRGTRGPDWS